MPTKFYTTTWWGGGNQAVCQDILDQMQPVLEHEDTELMKTLQDPRSIYYLLFLFQVL
jgi:hypothetical protein